MRKLLLIAFAAILIVSCKKDNTIAVPNLTGSWEYRGTLCFCVPPTDTTASKPGNGTIYSFNGNTYKHYIKHVLKKSGTFKLIRDAVDAGADARIRIIFDNDTDIANVKYITVEGLKLTISGSVGIVADGPEDKYEKQLSSLVEKGRISN
ncbi:hypothetical protein [Mucilaginibacter sp. FT3.2]|uniref:hypothetical protein n=1 Tax=Mucilaginibacter sp. FT3.2 TaxID=2723090 RepID=UPI001612CCE8|nr:hypothetical protein [Mucilaginibacter sp. FT3.2]MBB6230933.1 hypothetical protein [Mucilaginibacter sp. FT3.2]